MLKDLHTYPASGAVHVIHHDDGTSFVAAPAKAWSVVLPDGIQRMEPDGPGRYGMTYADRATAEAAVKELERHV